MRATRRGQNLEWHALMGWNAIKMECNIKETIFKQINCPQTIKLQCKKGPVVDWGTNVGASATQINIPIGLMQATVGIQAYSVSVSLGQAHASPSSWVTLQNDSGGVSVYPSHKKCPSLCGKGLKYGYKETRPSIPQRLKAQNPSSSEHSIWRH